MESSTTMSGGNSKNTSSSGAPRLELPSDAVPLADMIRSQPGSTSDDADQPVTPPADTSAAESKGKGKEQDAPTPPSKQRRDSLAAIGPAQDDVRAAAPSGTDGGPVCSITLLLTSGSRHPYKIDARYLTRRNVAMPEETEAGHPDPFSISIYTLKELILREWRNDWEAKPASPSSIRLIHFGKLLEDKEQTVEYQFSTENPNVVHMSVRPSDLDEEEPKAGAKSLPAGSGDGHRSRPGGGCCVIL
ncbi:ubiquitin-2 like rad60 SUMO-like domain-containing protein [Hirsutella rhossiliensis]|uniref:Ubiquitin-2 like rad60 SUMO-like domain-containing protein n=1 Tax=Hirsutella rhossiliensis TaxID=111463 RepID=A0A9P8N6W4_9HYPO|nr:ubiquitin-2 like rad60 SUMO-like domain-containing protein [Hirsutella rhossiliensis]KAH0965742.1 ubiquitin-2 like rad60 SUMO-like domain-containing protein [Hirsutella rhossiliensis]